MATTPNPLIWDFSRQIGNKDGLGGVVHYYDEESQTLYLKDGDLATKTAEVNQGHWSSSSLGDEIIITNDDDYSMVRFDHPINGTLYGVGINDDKLIFLRYVYAQELTTLVKSFDISSQSDNPIDQMSLSIQNIGADVFGDTASLFNPGARIPIRVRLGNTELYSLGVSWIDEVDYSVKNEDVSLSGRNSIGYTLKDQTFDKYVKMEGKTKYLIEQILTRAGVKKFEVQDISKAATYTPANKSIEANDIYELESLLVSDPMDYGYVFEPDKTFMSAIDDITSDFSSDPNLKDYGMQEMTNGTVIIGTAEWRSNKIANSKYTFNLGRDAFSRNTTKNVDAAYSKIRATGTLYSRVYDSSLDHNGGGYVAGDCVYGSLDTYSKDREYGPNEYVVHDGKVYYTALGVGRSWLVVLRHFEHFFPSQDESKYYNNTSQFDPTKEYRVGDYVKMSNMLWICIEDVSHEFKPVDWVYVAEYNDNFFVRNDVEYSSSERYNYVSYKYWTYRGHNDLEPITKDVTTFDFWSVGTNKTKHVSAPYPMKPSAFEKWVIEQRDALQYTGINEQFVGPFRPQLLVGDIAEIVDGDETTSLGIITDIKHSFSRSDGLRTEFTVDSGGVATDGSSYVIYSRSAKVNGYNRKQRISDLVKILSKG